jgi:DNA-binding transcriptional ArsR family regulator
MRPMFHPSIEDVTVEGILHALSDPVRAAIFTQIEKSGRSCTCSDFLNIVEKGVPKSTLSQHFKSLREAGLIRSERSGVEMHSTSRCSEIDHRFSGLIRAITKAHDAQKAQAARRNRRQA